MKHQLTIVSADDDGEHVATTIRSSDSFSHALVQSLVAHSYELENLLEVLAEAVSDVAEYVEFIEVPTSIEFVSVAQRLLDDIKKWREG